MKQYLIDKEPVDGNELIKRAKELGYEGYGGIFMTSQAAGVLRENGYTVVNNPELLAKETE